MKKILPIAIITIVVGCITSKKNDVKNYSAGFKIVSTVDSTRLFKPGSDSTDYLHFRPIDIDIWYPAIQSQGDTAMKFRNLLGLLESRANYYSASNIGTGVTRQLSQYFCELFKCSDSSSLLNYRSNSFERAAAAEGKFPLVVYLASFDGMSYENVLLFEAMAKRGFVVACINSIGRYP